MGAEHLGLGQAEARSLDPRRTPLWVTGTQVTAPSPAASQGATSRRLGWEAEAGREPGPSGRGRWRPRQPLTLHPAPVPRIGASNSGTPPLLSVYTARGGGCQQGEQTVGCVGRWLRITGKGWKRRGHALRWCVGGGSETASLGGGAKWPAAEGSPGRKRATLRPQAQGRGEGGAVGHGASLDTR